MSWPKTILRDVCRVVPGFAFSSRDWSDDGIPVLKIKNIVGDLSVDLVDADCVPRELVTSKLEKYVLQEGDIVVAMTGATAGKVGRIKTARPVLLNQRVAKIEPVSADKDFIWAVVSSDRYQNLFYSLADGAAQPNMSASQIEAVPIPLPPHNVQRRIADILSAYDDLIEVNKRRIAILEEMARRLFEEWFVRFRYPGHEGKSIVESEIGSIPSGWEICRLEQLCTRITDGAHKSPATVPEGLPMASVKDMTDWDFDLVRCRQISSADFIELERNDCRPRLGDILIAKDGSYLKHSFMVREDRPLAILSSIAMLRPNGRLLPELFVQALREPRLISRLKGVVSGVAIPRIVLKDFRRFQVACPPSALQSLCSKLLEPLHQQCWQLSRANTRLRAARDLLLPKIISGKMSVSAALLPSDVARDVA